MAVEQTRRFKNRKIIFLNIIKNSINKGLDRFLLVFGTFWFCPWLFVPKISLTYLDVFADRHL